MILFLIALTVIAVGLTAIEFSQAAPPRRVPVWNDDVERQLLRQPNRRRDRW